METTKYYLGKEEVTLNKDNWWFVMLDGTIRTIFGKYETDLPKYVIVEELSVQTWITIVRQDIYDFDSAYKWKENKPYIMDELEKQAMANSLDDEMIFQFKII